MPSTRGMPTSFCSTARAGGTRRKTCGWDGSASAERWRRSTLRFAASRRISTRSSVPSFACANVKYVIALDSDTQLPRDAARLLVGTMAHPLNRPVYDPKLGRVIAGYSILQPRIGVTVPSAARSHFARLFAGDSGIDPYTRAISDVYQDVFDEGSFVGKGIYDVDALRRAIHDRFPENRILSHDLLEGAYGRAGLVSDVVLFEDYPLAHAADVSRRSRWIRGDWQITPWLLSLVPGRHADAGSRSKRHFGAVAMEDPRQPAPEPGSGGVVGGAARRLGPAGMGSGLDPDGRLGPRVAGAPDRRDRARAPPRRALDGPTRMGDRACPRAPAPARGVRAGLPSLRRLHQPRSHRAYLRARCLQRSSALGMADGERRPTQRRRRPREHLRVDVDPAA